MSLTECYWNTLYKDCICKFKMTCGNISLSIRVFYLNGLYLLTILLSSISIGVISPMKWVNNTDLPQKSAGSGGIEYFTFPRYQSCKLNGNTTAMTEKGTCIKFDVTSYEPDGDGGYVLNVPPFSRADHSAAIVLETIFVLSIIILLANIALFICSVFYHFTMCSGRQKMLEIRPIFSLINIGLFAGLVGWLNGVKDISADYNVEHNVYFENYNLVSIAIAGLVIHVVDIVCANLAVYKFFKSDKCFN